MDYLARESAPFSSEIWERIDNAVIENLKRHLVCRRFLSLYGPLGAGTGRSKKEAEQMAAHAAIQALKKE